MKWIISGVLFSVFFIGLGIYLLLDVNHLQQEIESNQRLIKNLNKIEGYIRESGQILSESHRRDLKDIHYDLLRLAVPLQKDKVIGKFISSAVSLFEKNQNLYNEIIISRKDTNGGSTPEVTYLDQVNKAINELRKAEEVIYKEQGRASENLKWTWRQLIGMLVFALLILIGFFIFNNYLEKIARKDIEKKIEQTTLFLDIIIENIPSMIFIKDAKELRFVRINKAGESLLGLDRKELIGKNDYDFFPKEQADFFTNKDREVLAGKEVVDIPEEQIQTRLKGIRWLHTKKIPLLFENGQPQFLFGISLDITEEKKAVDKIKKFNEELEEKVRERTASLEKTSSELKDQINERTKVEEEMRKANLQLIKINNDLDNFIYTASHDLRAPISNIEGLIVALSDSFSEEAGTSQDVEMILDLIRQSIKRFKNTIQDLTDIAKVQKNVEESAEEINVKEMVEDEIIEIKAEILKSKATIKIDTDAYPIVKFPRKDLKSIIYNLLNNAIKYKSPDRPPEIEISTRADSKYEGKYIILSVKDNGLGIPSNQKGNIFLMFRRLYTHVEGTGIGLYIVKRIVENQGGKIEVESELGKGSRFNVYILKK